MQAGYYFYKTQYLSTRWRRLAKHCLWGIRPVKKITAIPWWWFTAILLFLEAIGLGDLYQFIARHAKYRTRPLTEKERTLAQSVFGNSIQFDRVRIDENAWLGPRQGRFCYVSGYIINSWGPMHDVLLIHELMHVWQYERLGSAYIPLALKAQYSKEGYDYGGEEALKKALAEGQDLLNFNLEQQAEIVADYCCILQNRPTRWGRTPHPEISYYQKILNGSIWQRAEATLY